MFSIQTFTTLRSKIPSIPTSIIKNFTLSAGSGIVLKTSSILILPFILRSLNPTEYGQFCLLMSATAVANICAGLGLRQMLSLEYFHCNARERSLLVQQLLALYTAVGLPVLVVCAAFSYASFCISPMLLMLVFLYCNLSFLSELTYQLMQYDGHIRALVQWQLLSGMVCALMQLMLVQQGFGVTGLMSALLASTCLGAYAGFNRFYTIDFLAIKQRSFAYLQKSILFIPGMLGAWVIANSNRWLLARYATIHDVGIYAVADTATVLFQVFILAPLGTAYVPYLLNAFAAKKDKIHELESWNRRLMWASTICLSAFTCIGYHLALPLLRVVVPLQYQAALPLMGWITLGNIFLMGTYFACCLIQFHKKTYFLAAALCIPAVLNILLNLALIPILGMWGCVWATVIAYAGYFALVVWYGNRLSH